MTKFLMATLAMIVSAPLLAQSDVTRYIVTFEEPGLVKYDGGVQGIPEATRRQGSGKLKVRSQAARDYIAYLENVTRNRVAQAEQALSRTVDIKHVFKATQSGFIARLSPSEAEQVAQLDFVVEVREEPRYQLLTDAGPDWVNADNIWNDVDIPFDVIANEGEGQIMGMIDSGVNSDHPSFADISPADGFDHTNPLGAGNFLGECDGGGFPCNDKLIGAWNFTDGPEDSNGHGSHTSSTAVGNRINGPFTVNSSGANFDAPSVSGVAPHANLIAYDACDGGCFTSGAIDQAIADGVDIISYSIGPTDGRGTNPWTDFTSQQFLDAVSAGIFVSAAAGNTGQGNDNAGADVVNKGPWTMTVANNTHNRINSNTVSITNPGSPPADVVDLFGLVGTGPAFTSDVMDENIVYAGDVDPDNFEGCTQWTGTPFQGAVALISRGSCTFEDKVNFADAAGAVAVIVFNNAGRLPIVMGGLESTPIPSVMIGQLDGEAIVTFIDGAGSTPTVFIDDQAAYALNDDVADVLAASSLTGPNLDFDITEPDLGAPGSNIFAAVSDGANPPEFDLLSGTSMATPHVAGAAALLRNARPELSVMETMSIMKMTARQGFDSSGLEAANWDLSGHGILDLREAANAVLVMDESMANIAAANPDAGGDPASLNLPNVRSTACSPNCSWTRTVRSTASDNTAWTANGSGLASAGDQPLGGANVSVSPTNFELAEEGLLFRDSMESGSTGPVSDTQTLTIEATGVSSGSSMIFGQVDIQPLITRGGLLQFPTQRITVAVSESVPPPPPVR